SVFVGAEATWRDVTIPILGDTGYVFEDQSEQLHRAYIDWSPSEQWALTGQLVYDRFQAEPGNATNFGTVPEDLETISVPLGLRYFHPSGFFAGAGVTYVHQRVVRAATAKSELGLSDGTDEFVIVDAAL